VARERAGLVATPPPTAAGGAQQPVGSVSHAIPAACICCRVGGRCPFVFRPLCMTALCAAWWQGTIEYAADKLEQFRQQLELKVVSRFDVAAGKADFPAMAQCASIMSHFPRGSETLINVSPLSNLRPHAEHLRGR
jgi:hypothetical protein